MSLLAENRLVEPIERQVQAIQGDWAPLLQTWVESHAGRSLIRQVDNRLAGGAIIYPADVFRALALTPLSQVRVVILGQDPYHGPGQAEGLAFSVPGGVRVPPSLRNIFTELRRDLGIEAPSSGNLQTWAQQGVLLLNTALTVEDGRPSSHEKLGWEALTDEIIIAISKDHRRKAFMLWGAKAQSKAALVQAGGRRHLVLQCNHPSPLSATRGATPFIGCGHFSRARAFVAEDNADAPLDWRLQCPGGTSPAIQNTDQTVI